MKKIYEFILNKIMRWTIIPDDKSLKESSVVAVFPHTSYWDGFIGWFAMKSLGVNFKVISAEWLFFWPFKYVMKYLLHAFPVGSNSGNAIKKSVDILKSSRKTHLIICPEGQLKATDKWNIGFWMISKKANVPIDLAIFDYDCKIIYIKHICLESIESMSPKGLLEFISLDCEWLAAAKYPENFKLPKI